MTSATCLLLVGAPDARPGDTSEEISESVWLAPRPIAVVNEGDLTGVRARRTDCYPLPDQGRCGVRTSFGEAELNLGVATSGSLRDAGPFGMTLSLSEPIVPVPNSDRVLTYACCAPFGQFLFFRRHFAEVASLRLLSLTALQYIVSGSPEARLNHRSGTALPVEVDGAAFSANGRWLVVDAPGAGMLRVDLESPTYEWIAFGPPHDYTLGLNPAIASAVTNDGRYVAVAAPAFRQGVIVYDLETCTSDTVPIRNGIGMQCESRRLDPEITAALPGYNGRITRLSFADEETLTFEAAYDNSEGQVRQAAMFASASGESTTRLEHLALGDSFSSGDGAYDYIAGTDTPATSTAPENRCRVSRDSYPFVVAEAINVLSVRSAACSGATTHNIADTAQWGGDRQAALSTFLPGVTAQLDFVRKYRPAVITIGIGGNDIGFGDIVQRCTFPSFASIPLPVPTVCYPSYEERLNLLNSIRGKFDGFVRVFMRLKAVAPPTTRIYVVGYPQIVLPTGGNCALNVHLADEERLLATQLVAYLNGVLASAARRAGLRFIDVEHALDGQRMCETSSGNVAVNGLTSGDDRGPVGSESFHPNKLGHRLIAAAVLRETANLTLPMLAADPTAAPPTTDGLDILAVPRSDLPVTPVMYDVLGRRVTHAQAQYPIEAGAVLQPTASYTLTLHSDPIALGGAWSDATGRLRTAVSIPAVTPVGWHEIHVSGYDVRGRPLVLAQPVFVGARPADMDGNGLADALQPCVFVDASSTDSDRDGIDDACDGFIADVPADLTAPTVVVTQAPDANDRGWNASGVSVRLAARDDAGGSGVATIHYTVNGAPTTVAGDQAEIVVAAEGVHEISYRATDEAGNASDPAAVVVRIDETAPVAAASAAPPPNAHGWNNTQVFLEISGHDNVGGSGVATLAYTVGGVAGITNQAAVAITLSSSGVTSVTYWATDGAGNASVIGGFPVKIDADPPHVSAAATTAPNADGWYGADVTVQFACTDALAGVEDCPEPLVAGEGRAQTVSGTARDFAGNSATATLAGINVDRTPPVVSYSGNAHSYTVADHVEIDCEASDALSGIRASTCVRTAAPAYTFALGLNSATASASDLAGHTTTASTSFTVNATCASIKVLVLRFVSSPVADSLIAKINAICDAPNGAARSGTLEAFRHEVDAQTAKTLTASEAAILKRLAGAL